MPVHGLIALLDDVATMLDDVAVLGKQAIQQAPAATGNALKTTSGVIGDDVAVTARVTNGLTADREIPMIRKIRNRSLLFNKPVIGAGLLAISALSSFFLPGLPVIAWLLMPGGAYLGMEAAEKVLHSVFPHTEDNPHGEAIEPVSAAELEQQKVDDAVRTDFILSLEIMGIALGTVATAPFLTQALVLAGVGVSMTYGVYGVVQGIVRMDDLGLHLARTEGDSAWAKFQRGFGKNLYNCARPLLKGLTVAGTAAMLLVGGELIINGLPFAEHFVHGLAASAGALAPAASGLIGFAVTTGGAVLAGAAIGLATLGAVTAGKTAYKYISHTLGNRKDRQQQQNTSAKPAAAPSPQPSPAEPSAAPDLAVKAPLPGEPVPSIATNVDPQEAMKQVAQTTPETLSPASGVKRNSTNFYQFFQL